MTVARKLTANFIETEVDDEVLIVDLDGGELFSLSGTALDIWRLIDGESDSATIVRELSRRYDAPADRITNDVERLLADLQAAALVALR